MPGRLGHAVEQIVLERGYLAFTVGALGQVAVAVVAEGLRAQQAVGAAGVAAAGVVGKRGHATFGVGELGQVSQCRRTASGWFRLGDWSPWLGNR